MATEGDVPDASRIPLPAGSEVVSRDRECASGGCWITLTVRPPSGQTPTALAEAIGATPKLEVAGHILDPRSFSVWAKPGAETVLLRADYWAQELAF